ncbi:MAG: M20/M25/M40 family metallo-hydrolase [Spirochaetia bacterium]|jgi:carboxypeptidase PM20D1|nr:M20/M25/M40 family metallo-hydrolase [Spirochaetia bacterium]
MILLILVILLIGVLLFQTFAYRDVKQIINNENYSLFPASEESINHLSKFIQLKTVTYNDFSEIDMAEHRKVEGFFRENFPLSSNTLNLTKLNDFAYIFCWEGRDTTKKPVLFMAHFDVVPVQDEGWDFPPFCGEVKDGNILGRGTLDTKNSLLGILEASEKLIADGFTPESTIYFAFGGDEEVMGLQGAGNIVKYFQEQNICFEWLLDEGAIIAENMISMTDKPLALIGIAEKGFANVRLIAHGVPGHASMPPDHTASGLIARAVYRIENNPFPVQLTKTVRRFLKSLIPHVSFSLALVFSNLWLFAPIVKLIFKKSPSTAAMVRTTQAVTILKGSKKDNILPDRAEAIVNVRILPGQTKTKILKRMRSVVNDPLISVEFMNENDASNPVSESSSKESGYIKIKNTVNKVYPEGIVSPFLVTATTDSRHYKDITENIYRFVPMVLTGDDLKKIHGFNESISIENYTLIINFFTELMKTI